MCLSVFGVAQEKPTETQSHQVKEEAPPVQDRQPSDNKIETIPKKDVPQSISPEKSKPEINPKNSNPSQLQDQQEVLSIPNGESKKALPKNDIFAPKNPSVETKHSKSKDSDKLQNQQEGAPGGPNLNKEAKKISTKVALAEWQQKIKNAEAKFKEEQISLQEKEQAFQENIADLRMTSEITIPMLDEADEGKITAQSQLETLRVEHQRNEDALEQQRQVLQEKEEQLVKVLNHEPSKPQEINAQNKQTVVLEKEIDLEKKLLGLQEKYLEMLNHRIDLANKQLKLANDWNETLKNAYWKSPIEERNKMVQEDEDILKRQQQVLPIKQKELSGQIARLETMETQEIVDNLKKASDAKDSANLEVENLKLEYQNAEATLERQRKNLKEQMDALESLKKSTGSDAEQSKQVYEYERKTEIQKRLIDLDESHLEIRKKRLELARQFLNLASHWQSALQKVNQGRKQQDLESLIQTRTAPYLTRATDLRKQLQQEQDIARRSLLEAQIQEAEGQAQKAVYDLKLAHLQEQLEQLRNALIEPINKVPQDKFTHIPNLSLEFNELQTLLIDKIAILKQQREVVKRRGEILEGNELISQAENLLAKLIASLEQEVLPKGQNLLSELERAYTDVQRRELSRRREFPTHLAEWNSLFKDMHSMLGRFTQQLRFTGLELQQAGQKLSWQRWLVLSLLSFAWISLVIWVRFHINQIYEKWSTVRSFLTHQLILGVRLLEMNYGMIVVTGIFLLFVWLAQPSNASSLLVMILLLIWLGVKLLINLAWLLLSDKEVKTQNRSKIYQQVRWTLIVMGILTVITALGHLKYDKYELNTPLILRDWIDRVFMLCLSMMMFPAMRIRHMVLSFLAQRIKGYWYLVIQLISLLLPISFLSVATLGMIGYLNLGWEVAKYTSIFLLVLTLWLIAQGILDDGINFLKNFALRHSHYGLLWTQDIIPLGHKLLGLTLVGMAILIFSWLSGWYTGTGLHDAVIKEGVEQVFTYSLFKLGENELSLSDLLLFILALWGVFWFGGWCRRVTYRWIYSGITDLGVRNSLSVFTQYAVVLLGLLITLRVIGIDLTTLTVFAGALGVGIGFGLQNIANNFISGILLLIERPLRTGDIINIGGLYEGMVTEMGIRSLTVRTWDHSEVIIPNAELISRPFTNATHSNKIQRSILYIKVCHGHDPHQVKEVLKTALKEVSTLVTLPLPQVYLWELTDFSMNFRIEYFINLGETEGGSIKDEVLVNIWEHLEQAGIKLSYPH